MKNSFHFFSKKILLLLPCLLLLFSCSSDEGESIFGTYELDRWELSLCDSMEDNQVGLRSERGVCLTFPIDQEVTCSSIDITLFEDFTFVYESTFQIYDLNGKAISELEESITSGSFNEVGESLNLESNEGGIITLLIDEEGNLIRVFPRTFCDSRQTLLKR